MLIEWMPLVTMVGGFVLVIVIMITTTISRTRIRELELRERIAMIERGLVPPPEADPAGFDRAMYRYGRHRTGRHRRAGGVFIGIGLGLIVMMTFADWQRLRGGYGLGAFFLVFGAVLFLLSYLNDDRPPHDVPRGSTTQEPARRE